jgi:hypothetical protein
MGMVGVASLEQKRKRDHEEPQGAFSQGANTRSTADLIEQDVSEDHSGSISPGSIVQRSMAAETTPRTDVQDATPEAAARMAAIFRHVISQHQHDSKRPKLWHCGQGRVASRLNSAIRKVSKRIDAAAFASLCAATARTNVRDAATGATNKTVNQGTGLMPPTELGASKTQLMCASQGATHAMNKSLAIIKVDD